MKHCWRSFWTLTLITGALAVAAEPAQKSADYATTRVSGGAIRPLSAAPVAAPAAPAAKPAAAAAPSAPVHKVDASCASVIHASYRWNGGIIKHLEAVPAPAPPVKPVALTAPVAPVHKADASCASAHHASYRWNGGIIRHLLESTPAVKVTTAPEAQVKSNPAPGK